MNVEEIQDFCLSLGNDVEEKLPFVKFKNGEGVLVFYVCGLRYLIMYGAHVFSTIPALLMYASMPCAANSGGRRKNP